MSDVNDAAAEAASEQSAVSIDDTLGSIFDEIETRDAAPAEQPAETAEAGQDRDEQGRFKAAGEQAEEAAAEEAAPTDDEVIDQSAEQTDEPVEDPALDPPNSWSDVEKALWPGLSREAQDVFLRREGDWQKQSQESATKLKGYEPIEAALEPVRQLLTLNGVAPATYVGQLVTADQMLRTQPMQAIQQIAGMYGIDLSQITQQAESPDYDPAVAPVVNELNQLKAQFSEFMTTQQQADQNWANAELSAFATDHPHYEDVRSQMGVLIGSGSAADLQTAYDMAVWSNPETRAKLLAEQSGAAEAKRKEEAAARAAKARKVADTNLSTNGTGGGATPASFATRDDELSATFDRIQGAA